MKTELTGIFLRSSDAETSIKLRRVKINQESRMKNDRWQGRRVGFFSDITPVFEARDCDIVNQLLIKLSIFVAPSYTHFVSRGK